MESGRWKTIYQKLEKNKDLITPANFRFYNIGHLSLLARKTEEFSVSCPVCRKNLAVIDKLADTLPQALKNERITNETKLFEKQKESVIKHLRKIHHLRFPGYYSSLYSFIGLMAGIITGISLSFIFEKKIFTNYSLIIIILLTGIGRLYGILIDRKLYREKRQI